MITEAWERLLMRDTERITEKWNQQQENTISLNEKDNNNCFV